MSYPDEDYDDDEPVASCEICGMNIYAEDDDGTDLLEPLQLTVEVETRRGKPVTEPS